MSHNMTALRCLFLVSLHHGVQMTPELLMGVPESDSVVSLLHLMREVGLTGKVISARRWKDLISLGSAYPALAELTDGNWVIVIGTVVADNGVVDILILDPRDEPSGHTRMSRARMEEIWSGRLVLCKRKAGLFQAPRSFGLGWFLPEIMGQGRYLRDVALAATMCSLISFATPLFFNVIIDKVIPHHSYQTLFAVIVIFTLCTLFDAIFSYVRQYLMLYITKKIDANLAAKTFDHLLRLPMQFFEESSAGVLLRNLQQVEVVRQFLTGKLFQTLLDVSALPILLLMLALYSGLLTLVVLLFSAAIAAVIGLLLPTFRRLLNQLYQAEGAYQADLVETIHGMRAVKSLALEPLRKKSWNAKVADLVRRRAAVGTLCAAAMVMTSGLEKMMLITVLGLGASRVFDGLLSIGALVAFNMLSGRVTGPLVQIVALINEYQQTALSLKMLGTVMNHPTERDPAQRGIRTRITGQMEFSQVTFLYEGTVTPALDRVSFRVEEGQIIGIVGRSGSGKTTVTRLIQGIHTAQQGLILLNGDDIRHIDLGHLRRSIGVVLQDNILFRGTVRDNIAATRPHATLDEVRHAARMAGAEEFIDRLPLSYETLVGEGAVNFSGGQCQRLAIARALLSQPRLLIFDEATSALDPDSEAIIQQNLGEIANGRTMIIVSHRLSSLVRADLILVLDQGKVMDFAPHATLLDRCDIYRHLWTQQTLHLVPRP